jgi:hypothetical protein
MIQDEVLMSEVEWMWNELHKKIDDGGMAEVMKDGSDEGWK